MPSQLVAYSGFSAANYIQEPYSADLDFGTGEFSLAAWVSTTLAAQGGNYLINSESIGSTGWGLNGVISVTPDTTTAPNGTTTADTLTRNAVGSGNFADLTQTRSVAVGANVGKTYTFSVFLWVPSAPVTAVLVISDANFNTYTSGGITLTTTPTRYSFTSSGGAGWNASGNTVGVGINLPFNAVVIAWGAQLEVGPTVTAYKQTTTSAIIPVAMLSDRSAASGPSFSLSMTDVGKLTATAFDGTTTRSVTTPAAYNTGIFTKVRATYIAGKLAITVNGVEVASATGTPLLSMNTGTPRHNLLLKTDQFSDAVWQGFFIKPPITTGVLAPDGSLTAIQFEASDSGPNLSGVYQRGAIGTNFGKTTVSVWARCVTGTLAVSFGMSDNYYQNYTLTTAWQFFTATFNIVEAPMEGRIFQIFEATTNNSAWQIWHPQTSLDVTALPYQRVNTATDYDTNIFVGATLTIGNSRLLDAPFPGSITMLKLGATVPTPEQATFMYEQEKHMFRPDAQITLPASSAVLDLAYDDAQDKWVAVQAGYESSFTGLIRTAAAVPSAGSFGKVVAGGGVKAISRTSSSPGVDIVIPAYGLREELVRRAEAAAKASKTLTVFDFDAVAGQTDFVLPVGWTAASVVSAGNTQREGATKNFTRLYDGFRETIRFAVAPGAAVWVRINAIKE